MRPKRSAKPRLGRLEKLDPTAYWQSAADVGQWLAEADTVAQLGETLGLDLALAAAQPEPSDQTQAVLHCQETDTGQLVLVVADLTDPMPTTEQLGQLVVQGAIAEAAVVVWVAAAFSPAQQRTLGWLNQLGAERACFFAVEVDLWRIGQDAMAANLTCVCQPADWDEPDADVATGPAATEEPASPPEPAPPPLSPEQEENLAFWGELCDRLDRQGSLVKASAPTPATELEFAIARAGFRLATRINREQGCLETRLVLSGEDAHPHFVLLAYEQDRIVNDLDLPLVWNDATDKLCTIGTVLPDVDITNRQQWPAYQGWFFDCLERFYETFFERIKQLDATHYQPLPDYGLNAPPNSLILPASQLG